MLPLAASGNGQCPAAACQLVPGPAIKRWTYFLAGQSIATRVMTDPPDAADGLYYLYSSYLGSVTFLTVNFRL